MIYCMYVCVCPQTCLTLCDRIDCTPPGSSVHGIFQSRILEWIAISSCRGSSWPLGSNPHLLIGRWIFYFYVTYETQDILSAVVVQLLSVCDFATQRTAALQAPLSSTVSWSLLNLCSLCQWCYLIISFSATPFSFCLQSFLMSGYFPWVSSLHQVASGFSASSSVLPNNQYQFIQYQFIHSVMSDSLQPHGLQHTRLPCPGPMPGACPNSCPLSRWCHPTFSFFVIPFSSRLQSFPASRSFPMSQFFTYFTRFWSFSFSISPFNEYSGLISFRMDWLDLLAVQVTLKSLLQHHSSKSINSLVLSFLYSPTLTSIHDHWKNHSFD